MEVWLCTTNACGESLTRSLRNRRGCNVQREDYWGVWRVECRVAQSAVDGEVEVHTREVEAGGSRSRG